MPYRGQVTFCRALCEMGFCGIDAAVALICWIYYYAELVGIVVLPWYVVAMSAGCIYTVLLYMRLELSCKNGDDVRSDVGCCAKRKIVLCSVAVAALLMILCGVYPYLLHTPFGLIRLQMIAAFFGCAGCLLLLRRSDSVMGSLFLGIAFVCSVSFPALFYSFTVNPVRLCLTWPFWVGIVAFGGFFLMRCMSYRRLGVGVLVVGSLLALFCIVKLVGYVESGYRISAACCPVIAGVTGCVWLLLLLRGRIGARLWYALGWPLMSLPAFAYLCYRWVL